LEVDGKRVLDLGCANFGGSVEFNTPQFFLESGATQVVGVDMTLDNLPQILDPNVILIQLEIGNTDEIVNLYKRFQPEIVKCDIEGSEVLLFQVPENVFKSVDQYAVEVHSEELYDAAWRIFRHHGYRIKTVVDLLQASPCKVVHAVH